MKNPCPGLWLADIQEQTKHLTSLTNNLITLSRMEEERTRLQMIDFPFSDVVEETVQSFQALARTQNKTFETLIQPMISLYGDEKSLTQLVSIQSVIFCGQFIHAILFCSLLLRLLSFDFSLRIFLAQAGQYLDAPEPGTYSTPHTVQFLAGIAAHRFVGMICNSSTKPMNL